MFGAVKPGTFGDDYFHLLRDEFSFLYKKYRLHPIEGHLWKFLRLRPVNFPTIRISQLAALIFRSHGLLSQITATESFDAAEKSVRRKSQRIRKIIKFQ